MFYLRRNKRSGGYPTLFKCFTGCGDAANLSLVFHAETG